MSFVDRHSSGTGSRCEGDTNALTDASSVGITDVKPTYRYEYRVGECIEDHALIENDLFIEERLRD